MKKFKVDKEFRQKTPSPAPPSEREGSEIIRFRISLPFQGRDKGRVFLFCIKDFLFCSGLSIFNLKIILILLLLVPISWNCTGARFGERPGKIKKTSGKKSDELSVKKYFDNIGEASYYADKFDGRITTSGEVFSQDSLTGAHLTLPFGTKVRVTNMKNNKFVVVTINDRPPEEFKRLIDLSHRAAKELGMLKDGITAVRIEVVK